MNILQLSKNAYQLFASECNQAALRDNTVRKEESFSAPGGNASSHSFSQQAVPEGTILYSAEPIKWRECKTKTCTKMKKDCANSLVRWIIKSFNESERQIN